MAKKKKNKWYVVWKGRSPGIYGSWDECSDQVHGYGGAQYKSFDSKLEAERNFENSYYVVWHGREPGVYQGWEECRRQIEDVDDAEYQSFPTLERARQAFSRQADETEKDGKLEPEAKRHINYIFTEPLPGKSRQVPLVAVNPVLESVAVDAACSGNPGLMEYRGVYTQTGEQIFRQGPFLGGTNNIGEFLALVHGLAYLKREGVTIPVYSDSKIAIGWVKAKKCKTELGLTGENEKVFELIERAEKWLSENEFENKILKWDTEMWGENPADFGRK